MAILQARLRGIWRARLSETRRRCEVLILGSGPGGSITAWTLAKSGKNVVVTEEGREFPPNSCEPFSVNELRQKYRAGGMNPLVGSPSIAVVEGKCLGGGSEINSGMYHRTPSETLALWQREFAVRALEGMDLEPHFEACESLLSVRLNPGRLPGPALKMRLGAETIGWKTKEVPRWFRYGDAPDERGQFPGKRQSMSEAAIPRAREHGCEFITGARVSRIGRRRNHWLAEGSLGGEPFEIEADAVFACCGALQTPALLRRSGIRRNIGDSLACHPTIKVVAVFEEEINDQPGDVAAQQVIEFAPAMSMGCSVSSPPYLAMAMAEHPGADFDVRRDWRRAAVFYAMIPGPATGTVRNLPFSTDPLVRHRLEASHLRETADALRKLCRLLFTAGAKALYPGVAGLAPLRNERDLRKIPEELPRAATSLMTIHVFSSCPMGEKRDRCAVDSYGQVFDHPGLFVNDASILCGAPGVNPQGTIMGLARRNALHYVGTL